MTQRVSLIERVYRRILSESVDKNLAKAENNIKQTHRSLKRSIEDRDLLEKARDELNSYANYFGAKAEKSPGISEVADSLKTIISELDEIIDMTGFFKRPAFLGRGGYEQDLHKRHETLMKLFESFFIVVNEYRYARDIGTSKAAKWSERR